MEAPGFDGAIMVFLDRRFECVPATRRFRRDDGFKFAASLSLRTRLKTVTDPSLLVELYQLRSGEGSYLPVASHRIQLGDLARGGEVRAKVKTAIEVECELSVRSAGELALPFERATGKFNSDEVAKMLNSYSEALWNWRSRTFQFEDVKNLAIYSRRGLGAESPMLSWLIFGEDYVKRLFNEAFFLNILELLEEERSKLSGLSGAWGTSDFMRKPGPLDPKTDWVNLVCYVPARCMNYRTDHPNDAYRRPFHTNCGDCEDLSNAALVFYRAFTCVEFKNETLLKMQRYARAYVPCFTLCFTLGQRIKVGSELGGHVCMLFLSRSLFVSALTDESMKGEVRGKQPLDVESHVLLGEATSIVEPRFQRTDGALGAVRAEELEIVSELAKKTVYYSHHREVTDAIGVRATTSSSNRFFRFFALVFTPHFYYNDKKVRKNERRRWSPVDSFVLGKSSGSGITYAVSFEDMRSLATGCGAGWLRLVPQPKMQSHLTYASELLSNFNGNIPDFRMSGGGFLGQQDVGGAFAVEVPSEWIKKLSDPGGGIGKRPVAYTYLSDMDIASADMRSSLDALAERRGLTTVLYRRKVSPGLHSNLLVLYKKYNIPESNSFLRHLYV